LRMKPEKANKVAAGFAAGLSLAPLKGVRILRSA